MRTILVQKRRKNQKLNLFRSSLEWLGKAKSLESNKRKQKCSERW
jgi:hypothetical protein